MNLNSYFFSGFLLLASPLTAQSTLQLASGPDAPQVGDIVPDTVTFAMSTSSIQSLIIGRIYEDNNFFLPNLEDRSYSDFPNEILATVYHTPW